VQRRRANIVQRSLTEEIGVVLAGFRKADDFVGYQLIGAVVGPSNSQAMQVISKAIPITRAVSRSNLRRLGIG
jgi:hypothetical protein